MRWADVGRSAAKLAPALGTALGGPVGGVVGGLVAAAYGVESKPDAVAQAIAQDPQAAVTLREIELRHAETIAALMTADVQDARQAHKDSWMPAAVTVMLVVMVSAMIGALMLLDTPPANREVVYLIAGQLIGAFATAIAYWLGSSRGSALKQDLLERR